MRFGSIGSHAPSHNAFVGSRTVGLTVPGEILQTARKTSECVDKILASVKERYINGIKSPLFSSVGDWITDGGSFFTLFGRMGTGKSFFAAKLYETLEGGGNVIYYSAHKLHAQTTVLKNMLYTVAYKLVQIPDDKVRNHLGGHTLPSDIDLLTEDIFIKPFEYGEMQSDVIFILDGLDEYSKEDCTAFLHALSSRKARIPRRVKIFFTGRPEEYIKDYLPHYSPADHYEIEEHTDSAKLDCVRFIEEKSLEKNLHLSKECCAKLIEKGEYSLNYLDLFLEEHKNFGELCDSGEIDNAPKSLYDYYNLQLHRYFTEAGKQEFYERELKGIIAALTVQKRPLSEEDICLIAKLNRGKLHELIENSEPLLVNKDGYISFYQDAMKEFFTSPACQREYRIPEGAGDIAISSVVGELILRNRFKRTEYFRLYAHEHLVAALEADSFNNDLWDTLISVFESSITSFSIVDRAARYILNYGNGFIDAFFSELSAAKVSSVLRERIFTRFLVIAFDSEESRREYMRVLTRLARAPFYKFYERIALSRAERLINKDKAAAKALAEEALRYANVANDDSLTLSRKILATDEIIRNAADIAEGWESIAERFESALGYISRLEELLFMEGDLTLAVKRDLSIIYDRMSLWLIKYDTIIRDEEARGALTEKISALLGVKSASFISLAVAALSKETELADECYASEEYDSKERLADLLPALKNIARIRSSRPEHRDDRETELHARRVTDTYELIYGMAEADEGELGKKAALSDAIGFLHAISSNYKAQGAGERALFYAKAAVDFAKRISDSDTEKPHNEYCYGAAVCFFARTLASIGGITEETLNLYGDAITHFNRAYELCKKPEEIYAKAAALVSGEIATLYTREDMHKEAIAYRSAAITRLDEIMRVIPSCSRSTVDEYDGQTICLFINKVYSGGFESASEGDAATLIAAVKRLSESPERKPETDSYISIGFILAHVFAAILNTSDMYELLSALRAHVINAGLSSAVGGDCEKAFSLKFMAEVAMKRGESPERIAELYEVAIKEFKEHSSAESEDEVLLSPASCYRSISDAYRQADDWAMARKYSALEIGELNLLTSMVGGDRFLTHLADCYYRHAIILECAAADESYCTHGADSAVDFYLAAVKICAERKDCAQGEDALEVLLGCLNELYGIVREDYDAMQELIESDGSDEDIRVFVNEGLRISGEIFDYLSESAQSDLAEIIKQFRDYLG